jgi:CubicO group peptidase (beta-lactamase class C family)
MTPTRREFLHDTMALSGAVAVASTLPPGVPPSNTEPNLQARLDRAAADFHLPGAAIALVQGSQVLTAITGVTNIRTGSPVVRETLFAAGSVTKVFTASLMMTYVDAGLVDLDAPVVRYLPDFTLQDKAKSRLVTVRMLLDHTGGLPGNCMFDLPKSQHMVAEIVARLASMPFNSEPGTLWSYSNAGMVVLGRIAEVLSGTTFDEALTARILRPLGLHATADTNEMILHSVAVGHLVDMTTGATQVVPRFQLDLSNSPAGATLVCDIAAMVEFARMHLRGGLGSNGTRVLSAASVAAMQTAQAPMPWGLGYDQMGLGWTIRRSGGHTVVSHTGANAGAHSSLAVVPDQQGAIAVLTNGTTGAAVHAKLTAELLQESFGVGPAVPVTAPATPVTVDLDRYTGVFVADDGQATFTVEDSRLRLEVVADPGLLRSFYLMGVPPLAPAVLTPVSSDGRFVTDKGMPVSFIATGAGRPEHVYVGRVYRRSTA